MSEPCKPSFNDLALALRFFSLSNRLEHMPTVELSFKSQRDLSLFLSGLHGEIVIGSEPEAALREGFTWAGIRFKLVEPPEPASEFGNCLQRRRPDRSTAGRMCMVCGVGPCVFSQDGVRLRQ